jgi:WD40 repeat protein
VIVSSDFNNSVQMYDTNGNYIRALVPNGGGGLGSPQGICVGPDGNIYVSSATTDQVLRYAPDGTSLGQFQTGGGLDQPWYLRFGPDGNLYVSSSLTSQVLCYDGQTGAFLRVAASGGGLFRPDGLEFDSDGDLLVSDFYLANSRIKKFDPTTGAFISDLIVDSGLKQPLEHRLSADGTKIFVSSFNNSLVREYDVSTGAFIANLATTNINGPVGQLILPGTNTLLVSNWNSSTITKYDATTGAYLGLFASGGQLNHPNNLTILAPEPASMALLATGTIGLLLRRARSSRRCTRSARR